MSACVAVTGASGSLGARLVGRLTEQGIRTVAFGSNMEKIKQHNGNSSLCSVYERRAFDRLREQKIDTLINCAFPRADEGSVIAGGLLYTRQLFEAVRDGSVDRVINISSQSVYSQTRQDCALENEPISPGSAYGIAKYSAELICDAALPNTMHSHVRLASLIGPEFSQRYINYFASRIVADDAVEAKGSNQVFGFLDLRDAADALICMALSNEKDWAPVYNLGPVEGGYSFSVIMNTIESVALSRGLRPQIARDPNRAWHNSGLNCSLFRHDFAWEQRYSLRESVEEIFDYYL